MLFFNYSNWGTKTKPNDALCHLKYQTFGFNVKFRQLLANFSFYWPAYIYANVDSEQKET